MVKARSRAVGILAGDGDCPGLSDVLRGATRAALQFGWDVYAIDDGFDGLLRKKVRRLGRHDLQGPILNGTRFGSSGRVNPFESLTRKGRAVIETDRSAEVVRNVHALGLAGVIAVGGENTLRTAERFHRKGLSIVGVPQAIENDIPSTAITFGFDTAVATASTALEKLNPTADAAKRITVAEVLGRGAGWLALHTGLASNVDVILVPEIPFSAESVCESIRARERAGQESCVVLVAEGATLIKGAAPRPTKETRSDTADGIGAWLAAELTRRGKKDVRALALGPLQRGGAPTGFDRFLGTRFGTAAMRLVDEGLFGNMVAFKPPSVVPVPLHQVVNRVRPVPLDSDILRSARDLGIGFGD